MAVLSDDDDVLSMTTAEKTPRQARFSLTSTKLPLGAYRRYSVGNQPSPSFSSQSTSVEEQIGDDEPDIQENGIQCHFQTHVTRTHSHRELLNCKEQWSAALLGQASMQESWKTLKEEVAAHEKLATAEKWEDLMLRRAEISELNKLAQEKQNQQNPGRVRKWFDEFSMVAMEYSKLLDIVMNSSPEYAAASWAIIKCLLAANINHADLKRQVAKWIVEIGYQLDIVNHLLSCSPTDVMVEAVATLYSYFSAFLGKALHCYDSSKRMKVVKAIAFHWKRKCQPLVEDISEQFGRIQTIAHANHIHLGVRTHDLVQCIFRDLQADRLTSQQGYDRKRSPRPIKEGFKGGVEDIQRQFNDQLLGMFDVFNAKWLQKFEDILRHRGSQAANLMSEEKFAIYNSPNTAFQSQGPVTAPEDYLTRFMASPTDILKFRDIVFPSLRDVESTEAFLRVRNRRLRTAEYKASAALLKIRGFKDWVTDENSGLLWLESYAESRFTDWMTAFVIDVSDKASQSDHNTVLRFFCQSRLVGQKPSTTLIAVQSLIFQAIVQHSKNLASQSHQFFRQRFEEAQGNAEQLWELLKEIFEATESNCIWIMVDRIAMLEETSTNDTTLLAFITRLRLATQIRDKIIKVLITARLGGRQISSWALKRGALALDQPIVRVSKGQGKATTVNSGRSRTNLTAYTQVENAASKAEELTSVDMLLASDSDESAGESINKKPAMLKVPKAKNSPEDSDDSYDSDTLSEDPFASESSSDDEATVKNKMLTYHSSSSEDSLSDTQSLSQSITAQSDDLSNATQALVGSQLQYQEDKQLKSGLTPKITIGSTGCSPTSQPSRPITPAPNSGKSHLKGHEPSAHMNEPIKRVIRWESKPEDSSDESDDSAFELL